MHIKLGIGERTWHTSPRERVKVQNESNNTAMPLLQQSQQVVQQQSSPLLFSAAVEQWKNFNVL